MKRPVRVPAIATSLSVLVVASLAGLLAACGAGFSTRDPGGTVRSGGASGASPSQATLPSRGRAIDPVSSWEAGDNAFRVGDLGAAQRHFGLVYIADPGFNGGQIGSAIAETCRGIGNDCPLVLGRLDLLRIEYSDALGPREGWVPEQSRDFDTINACFDHALDGRYDDAYAAGYSTMNAPLPAFSQLSRLCLDRVQLLRGQIQAVQIHSQAVADWEAYESAFFDAWARLDGAIADNDWDAIVDEYPRYKVDEEPIAAIVDSGVLSQDSTYAEDVIWARDAIEQVARWEEDHLAEYDAMCDRVRILQADDAYQRALMEYEDAYAPASALQAEIRSLELARDATTGAERRAIDRRIEAKEAEVRDIQRDLRRLMRPINDRREAAGLPERDVPYGLE